MNKKNAIEFLNQYDTLQKSCQIIDEQMFETASLLSELKREENSPSGEQSGKAAMRADKYINNLTNEYRHLSMRRRLLIHRIKLIESVVSSLPKNERKVIERFFLSPSKRYAAEELMEELEFEKTQIYRIRARGLEIIAEVISNIPLCDETCEDT